jgi:hypothetical protein
MNRILIAATVSAMACGSARSGATATINGSTAGLSLTSPMDVVSNVSVSNCTEGLTVNSINILISDAPGRCLAIQADRITPHATSVTVNLQSGSPITPGTYIINSTIGISGGKIQPSIIFSINQVNDSCSEIHIVYATTGSVTIDSIQGDAVSGSFIATGFSDDGNVPNADGSGMESGTLSGSFSAAGCHMVTDCASSEFPACG